MLLTLRRSTPGSDSRRNRAHWASGWGWERTASIRSSSTLSRAIRWARTGKSCSPTIVTDSVSKARVSRVLRTEPSIEFSNGTNARSDSPRSTARIASWTVGVRSDSSSPSGAASRSASSVKVPAGPR